DRGGLALWVPGGAGDGRKEPIRALRQGQDRPGWIGRGHKRERRRAGHHLVALGEGLRQRGPAKEDRREERSNHWTPPALGPRALSSLTVAQPPRLRSGTPLRPAPTVGPNLSRVRPLP